MLSRPVRLKMALRCIHPCSSEAWAIVHIHRSCGFGGGGTGSTDKGQVTASQRASVPRSDAGRDIHTCAKAKHSPGPK